MFKYPSIFLFLILFGQIAKGQLPGADINLIKKSATILPGEIINLPYFIKNNSENTIEVEPEVSAPENWNIILKSRPETLAPESQTFSVLTIQVPDNSPVDNYSVKVKPSQNSNYTTGGTAKITVKEIEKINLQLTDEPEYLTAGDTLKANYLLQNLGNTTKSIFIETSNCDVAGNAEIVLKPGETTTFIVYKLTSTDIPKAVKEFISVSAISGEKIMDSKYSSVTVFPARNLKQDLYHRLPFSLSATYVASNQQEVFQSAYQFEAFGSGTLDPEGKHTFEFLARGPDNSNLSFLGMYDQYYVSYANKNLELFAGEKAFVLTPLTESSRFGLGTENRLILNNGLFVGFLYLKPRYFEEISSEYAAYTGFEKDINNFVALYYLNKKSGQTEEQTHLGSINSRFQPFDKTSVEAEFSYGEYRDVADFGYRANLNTQFSIFRLAGSYYYAGKNYPGYYNNSTFYSGNISANITSNLSIGAYAREDFINAKLDTFFVYAPYSKSFQTNLNYKFGKRSYLKFYWREFERKDRLALDKFHYKTRSLNAQLNQKIKKLDYRLHGELGNTTNLLLSEVQNEQRSYRASLNVAYHFNTRNSVRFFGSWSNINSFVSNEQRNVTAGLSARSRISKNLNANFHIQNAYNIDDYYRNRNLMQFNLDYTFLKKHQLIFHSFYTIFRQQTENPELTFSVSYKYNLGIPVKQLRKAGDVTGLITDENDEPMEGVILHLLNKSTVTDKNGEFWFKSIQPGKHLLNVDRTNLQIDETVNIPTPIELDVIEDRETAINFKITKGAKVSGRFTIPGSEKEETDKQTENIIVELSDEFEQFRIATETGGYFSFPLVRPGNWQFKIYTTTTPKNYEIAQPLRTLELQPGENDTLTIVLKKKKRNIIFKSQNINLSNTKNNANESLKLTNKPQKQLKPENDAVFYTIQIGSFSRKIEPDSNFFRGYTFDYEKQIDNFYRYFIGKYESYEDALKAREKLSTIFNGAFIAKVKNDEVIYKF